MQQTTQSFAAATSPGILPQSSSSYSFASATGPLPVSNSYDSEDTFEKSSWNLHDHGPRDDEAFLGYPADRAMGGLSPAIAARERYMARKEAEGGSPYFTGNVTPYGTAKKGCFAGKRKWAWLVGLLILAAVAAGVVVGILLKRRANSGKGVTGAVSSDPNDPSEFTKDPRLHKSFYGLCYTPLNAQVRKKVCEIPFTYFPVLVSCLR